MEQTAIPTSDPVVHNHLVVVKPYRVRRGRVNAQILIDIQNMLSVGVSPDDVVYGVNMILKSVDFGLGKAKS